MKQLAVLALVAACSHEPDTVEPLVSETTTELAFEVHTSGIEHADYLVDVQAMKIAGSRIEARPNGVVCERRVASVALADIQRLRDAFAATQLIRLGEDSCDALESGCGGPIDRELGVTVGTEYYSEYAPCRQLLSGGSLESELSLAFGSVPGIAEEIVWNGVGYDVVGPCPGDDLATEFATSQRR